MEVLQILKGDLDPLQTYIDEYAYKNLDYKMPFDCPQVGKLIKIQQLGIQILNYKLKLNQRQTALYRDHVQNEH